MFTRTRLKKCRWSGFVTVLLAASLLTASLGFFKDRTSLVLEKIGVNRGICVVLGDKKCELAAKLAKKSQLLIYVQLTPDQNLAAARKAADAAGFYGTRIFIDQGPMDKLYLADNLADAVITAGDTKDICQAEVLRILRPGGKALLGKKELTKPLPKNADDWSHPYHGPDNNPQSQDKIATAPYLTQFLEEPRYAPLTQNTVASAGRVFKLFGNIAFKKREEAFLNSMVAFNGYNGTILWRRNLPPGIMVHRNTIIATPDTLYYGDDKSCKLIDTATGRLKDEIIPPEKIAGGTFWKWMALEDGVLFALTGEQEFTDKVKRWRRKGHGWPWRPISEGHDKRDAHWGFGRNVLAIDPETKKVLWSHHEDLPVDSRAMVMKNGRIYIFRFGTYLACLDAKTGSEIWRKTPQNAPELFQALGEYKPGQGPRTNWRTAAYLKCSDKALYFSGTTLTKLVAVSTDDGSVLWENPYHNFQLVLRDDGLYGIGGGHWMDKTSKKFDPLTGEELADFGIGRKSCTRPTGSADAVLFRSHDGGTVRLDTATETPQWISTMRPTCQDGVIIANGLLYWMPMTCDCRMNIYGVTCLGPAGDFDFNQKATEAERLQTADTDLTKVAPLTISDADWPAFRANAKCNPVSKAVIAEEADMLWQFTPRTAVTPTAPVTAGGMVFFGASDGIIRALDAATGKVSWKAYTAGSIRIAPTIWKGRLFAGSADGYAYCFEAKTGRLLWRFRAAPAERRIPVYGTIQSTWPAAAGVLVKDGTAYVAAGISNYDGTYLYALDAVTGKIKWQNTTSGHLLAEARTGISVQGHMLINDGKLYLASGVSVSPAVYDITDGKCLNDPEPLKDCNARYPRGWELSLFGNEVRACGDPFYGDPRYTVHEGSVVVLGFIATKGDLDFVWINNRQLACHNRIDRKQLVDYVLLRDKAWGCFSFDWSKFEYKPRPRWRYDFGKGNGIAVCDNAVVLAQMSKIIAVNITDRSILWDQPIPARPVRWGLATDQAGRVVAALEDGRIICFGQSN